MTSVLIMRGCVLVPMPGHVIRFCMHTELQKVQELSKTWQPLMQRIRAPRQTGHLVSASKSDSLIAINLCRGRCKLHYLPDMWFSSETMTSFNVGNKFIGAAIVHPSSV